jgi:hypothetical protein
MTRESFIKVLNKKRYSYEIVGNKIVVTKGDHNGNVNLGSLTALPSGVEFENGGFVNLESLTALPPGVEFKNGGNVYLRSLIGGWFYDWRGNIKGIKPQRLLNKMIELGLFDKGR